MKRSQRGRRQIEPGRIAFYGHSAGDKQRERPEGEAKRGELLALQSDNNTEMPNIVTTITLLSVREN